MLEVDRAEEPVEGVDYIHPDVEEIPTGFFDANVAAAGLSFEANPTTKLNEYIRLRDKEDKGPKLSKGEINKIAQERGFDSSGIEEGVNMAQLEQIFKQEATTYGERGDCPSKRGWFFLYSTGDFGRGRGRSDVSCHGYCSRSRERKISIKAGQGEKP